MNGTKNITVETDGGIYTVSIDRGPVNALSFDMADQLRDVFERLALEEDMRVVVLRTAGTKAWIAGNDVTEFADLDYSTTIASTSRIRTAFNALHDCPVPVVACIDGAAVGSGLCVASLCDIRVASPRAVFALPEIDVGILGGGRHALRLAGNGAARWMMFTGKRINAEEALRLHVIDLLVSEDTLVEETYRIAEQIAAKSPASMRLAKQAFNQTEEMDLRPGYERECTFSARSRLHPDAAEAATAWAEKRRPAFEDHRRKSTAA